jgi:hypothetical protein
MRRGLLFALVLITTCCVAQLSAQTLKSVSSREDFCRVCAEILRCPAPCDENEVCRRLGYDPMSFMLYVATHLNEDCTSTFVERQCGQTNVVARIDLQISTPSPIRGEKLKFAGRATDAQGHGVPSASFGLNDPVGQLCAQIRTGSDGSFSYESLPVQQYGTFAFTAISGDVQTARMVAIVSPPSELPTLNASELAAIRHDFPFVQDVTWETGHGVTMNFAGSNPMLVLTSKDPLIYAGDGSDDSYVEFFRAVNEQKLYGWSGDYTVTDVAAYAKGQRLFIGRTDAVRVTDATKVLAYVGAAGTCVVGIETGFACLPLAIMITQDYVDNQLRENVRRGLMKCQDYQRLIDLVDFSDLAMSSISLFLKPPKIPSRLTQKTTLKLAEQVNVVLSGVNSFADLSDGADCGFPSDTSPNTITVQFHGHTRSGNTFEMRMQIPARKVTPPLQIDKKR